MANKYKNKKVERLGHKFDSLLEADVFDMLMGVKDLKIIGFQEKVYLSRAKILYKPDFMVEDLRTETIFYVEAKGMETATWRIKRRLYEAYGVCPLMVWMRINGRLTLKETIKPL